MLDENGVYSLSECHFKQRNLASLEVQYTTNVQTKAMPRDAVMTNTNAVMTKTFKFTFSRTISWYFWDMANQHDYSRKERKRVGKKKGKR